ncbi:MAG TPA: hypothetical protein VMW51_10395 [Terriglobia bacterium]|nr:hypothetical protein [Terriglobia bacterium]
MKLSDRTKRGLEDLLRAFHYALVVAAVFALTAFGILCIKAYPGVSAYSRIGLRGEQEQIAAEKQAKLAAHTIGIILQRVAIATDQAAKLTVAEQSYWRQQNSQMTDIFDKANVVLSQVNDKLVPSATRGTDADRGATSRA